MAIPSQLLLFFSTLAGHMVLDYLNDETFAETICTVLSRSAKLIIPELPMQGSVEKHFVLDLSYSRFWKGNVVLDLIGMSPNASVACDLAIIHSDLHLACHPVHIQPFLETSKNCAV